MRLEQDDLSPFSWQDGILGHAEGEQAACPHCSGWQNLLSSGWVSGSGLRETKRALSPGIQGTSAPNQNNCWVGTTHWPMSESGLARGHRVHHPQSKRCDMAILMARGLQFGLTWLRKTNHKSIAGTSHMGLERQHQTKAYGRGSWGRQKTNSPGFRSVLHCLIKSYTVKKTDVR